MGNWSKVMYDKLPMFYCQLNIQGYANDVEICFAAIGDATTDTAPLQVTKFTKGTDVDDEIKKLWLEGGGGDRDWPCESYELAAYYFARKATFTGLAPGTKPFLFITGDEGFYPCVFAAHVQQYCGDDLGNKDIDVNQMFQELRRKYHVFYLHKAFAQADIEAIMVQNWVNAVGAEFILNISEPKALADVMLGAIAMVNGARTLDAYVADLKARGQSAARQAQVQAALRPLAPFCAEEAKRRAKAQEEAVLQQESKAAEEDPEAALMEKIAAAQATAAGGAAAPPPAPADDDEDEEMPG